MKTLFGLFGSCFMLLVAQAQTPKIIFKDQFGNLPVGMFSSNVGPKTEYHYLPQAAPKGNWAVSCFHWGEGWGKAWEIIKNTDGSNAMQQNFWNRNMKHTHPMISAGHQAWQNYSLTTGLRILQDSAARVGVVVRQLTNRRYYFVGIQNGQAWIKKIDHETDFRVPNETTLASQSFTFVPNKTIEIVVSVNGNRIEATFGENLTLRSEKLDFRQGKIALLADQPAVFESVVVSMTDKDLRTFTAQKHKNEAEERALQAQNSNLKVWKKIKTNGFGVGRNLRFGDLNGDQQTDILIGQVQQHAAPSDAYAELSCLTALDLDGNVLWQIGKPDPSKNHLTNDVAFQIHDWDGDGQNEVIYTMNFEIIVADGRTGKTKFKAPTPIAKPPANRFERILGDCISFADFQGVGRKTNLIIKDRYTHFWVYDQQLNQLWSGDCKTGHFPFAYDTDQDGKDELLIGYSLYDHDGKQLWNHDATLEDHADAVVVVPQSNPAEKPLVFLANSDDGFAVADLSGKILSHRNIGHCQNVTVADFRPDHKGLETVLINFWGNQGTTFILDEKGNILQEFEVLNMGSLCLPVNWSGKTGEYFLTNANPKHGGMYDGWGRKVVVFPDDGHPDMCNAVMNLTGDTRDEIVVWNPDEIWIYTQADDSQKSVYQTHRSPQFNESNYRAVYSIPQK